MVAVAGGMARRAAAAMRAATGNEAGSGATHATAAGTTE